MASEPRAPDRVAPGEGRALPRADQVALRAAALAATLLALAASGCGSGGSDATTAADPGPRTLRGVADVPGGPVSYTVVLPDGYRPGRRYPVLVALPPGLQTRAQVDATLDRVWLADPARRRWVIVSPEAPAGTLFLDGGERVLVPFLGVVERRYPPRGGRVALAGTSNGGISAFALALAAPRRVGSLLAAPGYPPADADLTRLRGIRITMFVGENDTAFRPPMEATFFALRRHRIPVTLGFSPGDGHVVTAIPTADWYAALTPR